MIKMIERGVLFTDSSGYRCFVPWCSICTIYKTPGSGNLIRIVYNSPDKADDLVKDSEGVDLDDLFE